MRNVPGASSAVPPRQRSREGGRESGDGRFGRLPDGVIIPDEVPDDMLPILGGLLGPPPEGDLHHAPTVLGHTARGLVPSPADCGSLLHASHSSLRGFQTVVDMNTALESSARDLSNAVSMRAGEVRNGEW